MRAAMCAAMCGTDIADGATCLCACYAMSGTDLAYGAMPGIVGVSIANNPPFTAYGVTCLCACYAVSGTDIAYGAICLFACYAKAVEVESEGCVC
eukprot:3531064-Rhodomonas_salina.1